MDRASVLKRRDGLYFTGRLSDPWTPKQSKALKFEWRGNAAAVQSAFADAFRIAVRLVRLKSASDRESIHAGRPSIGEEEAAPTRRSPPGAEPRVEYRVIQGRAEWRFRGRFQRSSWVRLTKAELRRTEPSDPELVEWLDGHGVAMRIAPAAETSTATWGDA